MARFDFPVPQIAQTQNDGNNRWNNLAELTGNTGEANCNNEAKNQTFDSLLLRNFSNGDVIESTTAPLVTGFQVVVNRRRGTGRGGQVTDSVVQLRLASGQVGQNKASGANWPTGLQLISYGADGDLWGLTQAQANSVLELTTGFSRRLSNAFGVVLRPQGRNTAFIRSVSITVFYRVDGVRFRLQGQWVESNVRVRQNSQWVQPVSRIRINGRWVVNKT